MPETLEKRIADYAKLSQADIALVLKLRDDGHTQTAIAEKVGCSQPTVCRILETFSSTVNLAKLRTNNKAQALAMAAVKGSIKAARDGKPEAALEILDRIDVINKRRDEPSSSQVMVIVQQGSSIPGITLQTQSTTSLSPVPRNDLPVISTD
jgi:hypothetical protein